MAYIWKGSCRGGLWWSLLPVNTLKKNLSVKAQPCCQTWFQVMLWKPWWIVDSWLNKEHNNNNRPPLRLWQMFCFSLELVFLFQTFSHNHHHHLGSDVQYPHFSTRCRCITGVLTPTPVSAVMLQGPTVHHEGGFSFPHVSNVENFVT